jgi:hypothetical protein
MDIWNDPECKEMVLDFVRWSKEDLVEGVFQLRGSDGSVVAEYADLSDVPLRFTDPTSGAERAVHLEDVGVVWRLGRERWRDAAVDGELPDEFVQVLAKLLHWTERGMVRTNVQVRAPSGALVTSFPHLSDVPERVVDPRGGEEFEVCVDHVEVVYRWSLRSDLESAAWPWLRHRHPSECHDAVASDCQSS